MAFHCIMVRLRHYDDLGMARFVTVTCHRRLHLLTRDEDIVSVLEEIDAARREFDFRLLAWVIMPNHFHIVIWPKISIKLGMVIGKTKSKSARNILGRWRLADDSKLGQLQVIRDGEPRAVFLAATML